MLWNFAKPQAIGVAHRHSGIETIGDGLRDDCDALFLEPLNQLLLLGNQRINLRRLVIQKISDLLLFFGVFRI